MEAYRRAAHPDELLAGALPPPLTAKTSSTKTKQKLAEADSSELLMADNDR